MVRADRATLDVRLAALERRLVGPGGPFEIGQGPEGVPRYANGPRSLTDLYGRARRGGDKPLFARGAERRSYSDIFEPALAIADHLNREGWSGRRIALMLDDGPEWLVWFVAITAAGASCVLPPPIGSDDLISRCCETARCDAVVSAPSDRLDRSGLPNLFDLPKAQEAAPTMDVSPEVEAIVTFTSGSSGAPKGVMHSHGSLVAGLRNMMLGGALANHMLPTSAAPSAPSERPQAPSTLLLSPFAYIAGYSAFLLSIATGGRIILPESSGDDAVLAAAKMEGIQSLGGASPDLIRRLVRHPAALDSLTSLRRLQLHGAALQRSLVEELQQFVPSAQLFTGYGLSETAGSIAMATVAQVIDEVGGCGRLLPSVDVRVVDEAGALLPPGSRGALEVRGDMLMTGYLDEARTAETMTQDGWYRTGDMGHLEDGRWLNVMGRLGDQIAGTEGFAGPVEDAVRIACGVDDAAVTSSTDGTALILYLQIRQRQTIDKASAIEVLKSAAGWDGAIDVRCLKAFPRTASGKVDRLRLGA